MAIVEVRSSATVVDGFVGLVVDELAPVLAGWVLEAVVAAVVDSLVEDGEPLVDVAELATLVLEDCADVASVVDAASVLSCRR